MRSILVVTLQLLCVFSANVPFFSTSSLHSFQGCETPIPDRPNIPNMYDEIRSNLINKFKSQVTTYQSSAIFIKGGVVSLRYDTDVELPFRQESNFLYLTGATEPDLQMVLDVASGDSYMFIPKQDEFYAMWNGFILTPEDVATKYGIDYVYYHEDLDSFLNSLTNANNGTIYVLKDTKFDNMDNYNVNNDTLYNILMTVRVVKTKDELKLLRVAASVSSHAHIKLMKDCVPDLYEYNLESFFTYYCQSCSLRFQAYLPIVGGGNRSAILHYNANNRQLLNGDLVLIDAAAEYNGYAADITRTYPVNGKFSEEQKLIYEMVLRITLEMESLVKPGVTWQYLNTLTRQRVCEELHKAGFIIGDLNGAIQAQVCGLFLPHGLGHFLGLDVHDASLVPAIPANSVLTIEPGIYFNRVFMEMGFKNEKQSQFLNTNLINSYLDANFGGIRIEDDLIVNDNGIEIISLVPKSVKEIEQLMNQ